MNRQQREALIGELNRKLESNVSDRERIELRAQVKLLEGLGEMDGPAGIAFTEQELEPDEDTKDLAMEYLQTLFSLPGQQSERERVIMTSTIMIVGALREISAELEDLNEGSAKIFEQMNRKGGRWPARRGRPIKSPIVGESFEALDDDDDDDVDDDETEGPVILDGTPPVSLLNEVIQKSGDLEEPKYEFSRAKGTPDHKPKFVGRVQVDGVWFEVHEPHPTKADVKSALALKVLKERFGAVES